MENNENASPIELSDFFGEANIDESTAQQEVTETAESTESEVSALESNETTSETQVEEANDEAEESTEAESNIQDEDPDIVSLSNVEDSEVQEGSTDESESNTGVDFSEILNGQFSDEEDLMGYIQDLESKLENASNKTPEFANEYVEKMNQYVLNGGKAADFAKVQGVDLENMNPIEILTTELMWNNPGISQKDARDYIENKYEDAQDDEGNINMNNVQLKIDANQASKSIKDIQAKDLQVEQDGSKLSEEAWNEKMSAYNKEQEEIKTQKETDRMLKWMEPVEKAAENIKNNGITIPISDDSGFKFSFNKDDSYLEELVSKVDQALYSAGTSFDENPGMAQEMMELQYFLDNKKEIIQSAMVKGANSANKEWFKKIHNPSVLSRGDVAVKQQQETPSAFDQINKIISG